MGVVQSRDSVFSQASKLYKSCLLVGVFNLKCLPNSRILGSLLRHLFKVDSLTPNVSIASFCDTHLMLMRIDDCL